MNGVNLIPMWRRARRGREARVRMWVAIAPLCASLMAGAYGYLAVRWDTGTGDLAAKHAALSDQIEMSKREIRRGDADARELATQRWASRVVAEQPDWGLLLALFGDALGEETVLATCDLRPVTAPSGVSAGKERVRPDRYTLLLAGYSRTQEGVSQFVISLEKLGLFDSVAMKESRRTTMYSADAVEFRVECVVTDSAGDEK
jgi:hypothetical protein